MKVLNGVFDEDEAYIKDLTASFPDIDIVTATTPEDQKDHIRDAEVFHGFLTQELLAEARQLRWFHLPGAGIDGTLEVPGFAESDIILTNARGPHAPSMANQTMAMILNLAHKWHDFFRDQQDRKWDPWNYVWQYQDLDGRTMGILALGDVGMALARRAHGFGMRVYAADKYPKPEMAEVEAQFGEVLPVESWAGRLFRHPFSQPEMVFVSWSPPWLFERWDLSGDAVPDGLPQQGGDTAEGGIRKVAVDAVAG